MNKEEFEREIIDLINAKREGDYWDFKLKHHTKNQDLLHDIICMANNLCDRDAYIIYGIEDGTFEPKGVSDDPNRKTQQNIIDMLREKKFAGDLRPVVELKTFKIEEEEYDVLIIKNTTNTPYYLVERYKQVPPYHIYTRVGDVNTPKDKNADVNNIEKLWRKRFLLDKPPLTQMKKKLSNKEEWKYTYKGFYNVHTPEYKLIEDYTDYDNIPTYAYIMSNQKTSFKNLLLKYYETILQEIELVILDSGRLKVPTPELGFVDSHIYFSLENYDFRYYIKNSLSYDLIKFFMNDNERSESHYAFRRLQEVVLIFENEKEKDDFIIYSKDNIDIIDAYIKENKTSYDWIYVDENLIKDVVIREIKMGMAFVRLFKEYKDSY